MYVLDLLGNLVSSWHLEKEVFIFPLNNQCSLITSDAALSFTSGKLYFISEVIFLF